MRSSAPAAGHVEGATEDVLCSFATGLQAVQRVEERKKLYMMQMEKLLERKLRRSNVKKTEMQAMAKMDVPAVPPPQPSQPALPSTEASAAAPAASSAVNAEVVDQEDELDMSPSKTWYLKKMLAVWKLQ